MFTLQLCQSPFQIEGSRDIYALNFAWNGSHGCWNTIYSANLIEYQPHDFIGYLALGNQFKSGKTVFNVDFMLRSTGSQVKDGDMFKDFSIIGSITQEIRGNTWSCGSTLRMTQIKTKARRFVRVARNKNNKYRRWRGSVSRSHARCPPARLLQLLFRR